MKLLMSCAQGIAVCDDTGSGMWAPPGLLIGLIVAAVVVIAVVVALGFSLRRRVLRRAEWTPAAAPQADNERA